MLEALKMKMAHKQVVERAVEERVLKQNMERNDTDMRHNLKVFAGARHCGGGGLTLR